MTRTFNIGDRVKLRPDRDGVYAGWPKGETRTVVRTYPHKHYNRTWVVIDGAPNENGTEPVVDSRELRLA